MLPKRKTSEYGIYFGTEVISITEAKEKKATLNISRPLSRIISSEPEQKIPDEAKIVSALRDEFKKNGICPTHASIALSGEDLIIRTFDLPIFLSKKELSGAITFEAKKYIPFKIEELIFDFGLYPDRKNKKILVLFVGMKKEILNKYLSIFKELNIRPILIEYAGFSALRLLKLAGLKDSGLLGFLIVDLEEETNFVVCQNGFPLFSRDITLIPKSETRRTEEGIVLKKPAEISSTAKLIFMEKLKSEIRISLDFFRRKFPTKPLDRVIILSKYQFQSEVATLIKDLGLTSINLDISKLLSKGLEFSCALAKSFAAATSNAVKTSFAVNLLKLAVKKEPVTRAPSGVLPVAIAALPVSPKVILIAFLAIILTQWWGWHKRVSLEKELKVIVAGQPKIEGVSSQQDLKSISDQEKELSNKVDVMQRVVENRFYFTRALNIFPQIMPQGAWLVSISYQTRRDKLELTLEGVVFLADPEKEFAAVNDIVLGLKNNSEFSSRFKEIEVTSMERVVSKRIELEATKFVLSCRQPKE